jgi:maleylacetoacetate isomerase
VDLLAGEQAGEENLRRNPQGLVPTLEIDGLRLTQSLAIVEYLDETRGAGFLPPDPPGRARVRALAHAVAMDIHPVCNLRVVRHAVAESGGAIAQEDWMRHFIALGLRGLEGMLEGAPGPFCHGGRVTLPDLCLVPQLYNARRWGVDLGPFPASPPSRSRSRRSPPCRPRSRTRSPRPAARRGRDASPPAIAGSPRRERTDRADDRTLRARVLPALPPQPGGRGREPVLRSGSTGPSTA